MSNFGLSSTLVRWQFFQIGRTFPWYCCHSLNQYRKFIFIHGLLEAVGRKKQSQIGKVEKRMFGLLWFAAGEPPYCHAKSPTSRNRGERSTEKSLEGDDNTSPSDSAAVVTKVHSWIPRSWCYQPLEHKRVRSSHQLGPMAFPSPAPAGPPNP